MKIRYPEAGKIVNTHGFRGRVKAESWCDSPKVLAGLKRIFLREGGEFRPHAVLYGAVSGGFVLLDLEGIDSEEKAGALKGTVFYAAREDILPEDGVLLAEMKGLPVFSAEDGTRLGEIIEVTEGAASRLWRVRTGKGEILMPDVPAFVVSVSEEKAVVRPIPGLFDDNCEEFRE